MIFFFWRGRKASDRRPRAYKFIGFVPKILLFFAVTVMAAPSVSHGAIGQFVPIITDYAGELRVEAYYENHKDESDGAQIKTTESLLREKLVFSALGYIYHPRFIQFFLSISSGLKHEEFKAPYSGFPWNTSSSNDYELRAIILPEHPYKLELFTVRSEPFAERGISSGQVSYSSGGIFTYKKKPYITTVSYVHDALESNVESFTTDTFRFYGRYIKEYSREKSLALSAEDTYIRYKSMLTLGSGNSNQSRLSGILKLRRFNFFAHAARETAEQSIVSNSRTSLFALGGGVNVFLPWNFSANLSNDYSHSSAVESRTSAETKTSNETDSTSFSLTHRLFKSLNTGYFADFSSSRSPSGETKSASHRLNATYQKVIPGGFLLSTLNADWNTSDITGAPFIISEDHASVAVPGFFILTNQNIDSATLQVYLRPPALPTARILLIKNVHYTVTPFGNSFRIDINNLVVDPALPAEFPIPGVYNFTISYSMVRNNVKYETTTLMYSVRLSLFNNLISPYFTHSHTDQKILQGSFTGSLNSTSNTFGIAITKRPVTVVGFYQTVEADRLSSTTWSAEASYSGELTRGTQLDARVRYSKTNYPMGIFVGGVAYTDQNFGVSANLGRSFLDKTLHLYVGGAYDKQKGLSSSTAYTFFSNLTWYLGKTTLVLGGTSTFLDGTSGIYKTKSSSQYYYLNFKRRLF